ncbi:hypothetical protein LXL04_027452 [Taraxacum kok-saghyz]
MEITARGLGADIPNYSRSGVWEVIYHVNEDLGKVGINLNDLMRFDDSRNCWTWSGEADGRFSVRSLRKLFDYHSLESCQTQTIWCNAVPRKINLFVWRMRRDRLPTKDGLSKRGVMVNSELCPACNCFPESSDHLFLRCSTAKELLAHLRIAGLRFQISTPATRSWKCSRWLKINCGQRSSVLNLSHYSFYRLNQEKGCTKVEEATGVAPPLDFAAGKARVFSNPNLIMRIILVLLAVLIHAQAIDITKLRLFAAKNNLSCIYVFGDSSVDPGNNNNLITDQKVNFLPYGKDFYDGRPTGRFSNGRLATDLIAEALGHTKTIPAYLDPNLTNAQLPNGVSFASGGSGFDDLTAKLSNVISLSKQLDYFRQYKARLGRLVGKKRAQEMVTNSVFLLSMGTNDFLQNYYVEPTRAKQFTIDNFQARLRASSPEMHAEGARRLAVVGMEPFGCIPLMKALKGTVECDDDLNKVALAFNTKIKSLMATLQPSLRIKSFYTDIYGFIEASKGCCGSGLEFGPTCKGLSTCVNRSQYVYWDAVHFTEKIFIGYNVKIPACLLDVYGPRDSRPGAVAQCDHPLGPASMIYRVRVKEIALWEPEVGAEGSFYENKSDASDFMENREEEEEGGNAIDFEDQYQKEVEEGEFCVNANDTTTGDQRSSNHVPDMNSENVKDVDPSHVDGQQLHNQTAPEQVREDNGKSCSSMSRPPGFSASARSGSKDVGTPRCLGSAESVGLNKKLPGSISDEAEMQKFIKLGNALGYNVDQAKEHLAQMITRTGEHQIFEKKRQLWNFVRSVVSNFDGSCIIFGDFNSVRVEEERFGTAFCSRETELFNNFIFDTRVEDVPMVGKSFTRVDRAGAKMSRLDRFLASDGVIEQFPDLLCMALDRRWSDHCLLLLKENTVDYGPIPFKFFNSWMDMDGFSDLVEQSCSSFVPLMNVPSCINFKNKLKRLKDQIKIWHKDMQNSKTETRKGLVSRLQQIDGLVDSGDASENLLYERLDNLKQLEDIDKAANLDYMQKSKLKWVVEGDENSKFFHGVLNRRRKQMAVHGVMVNGVWVSDPQAVKDTFFDFFHSKFKRQNVISLASRSQRFKQLLPHQVSD